MKNQNLEELNSPLDAIEEDIFCHPDSFQNEPWYNDFEMYLRIGVCQPQPEHVLEVRKALKIMGYPTHVTAHRGKPLLVPGEIRKAVKKKEQER